MYVPPAFKVDDATAWQFVRQRGFGTLVAVDDGRPVASHLPFNVERTDGPPALSCHVARANPLHGIIARNPRVLLIVLGPDAYVSPDWYASTDQVSTWNYVSVHLSGTAREIPATQTLAHVDDLSAEYEHRLLPKKPWTSAKMTQQRREAMLRAIVPLAITVECVEAQWKLGQHKSAADQDGMLAGWDAGGANARALAEIARARRPR